MNVERASYKSSIGLERADVTQKHAVCVFAEHTILPSNPEHAAYVARLDKVHGRTEGKSMDFPTLFEAALMDCIANEGWLGDKVQVTRSPYDDLRHGVDVTIALLDENGHALVALSIDVTTSADVLSKKLRSIKYEIDEQELATVEYPGMPDIGLDSPQRGIPHCVISVSGNNVAKFLNAWTAAKEGNRIALGASKLRAALLYELQQQLSVFYTYAAQNDYHIAVASFEKAMRALEKVSAQIPKEALAEIANDPESFDPQLAALSERLSSFPSLPKAAIRPDNQGILASGGGKPTIGKASGTILQSKPGGKKRVTVEPRYLRHKPPPPQETSRKNLRA